MPDGLPIVLLLASPPRSRDTVDAASHGLFEFAQ
jgi:hypothetical protein